MSGLSAPVRVDVIASGKLRRYHHLPIWRQLLMPTIVVPNLIDSLKVAAGAVQSFFKLIAWRPDVVFAKGGFVCLPVGWAAHLLRIPLVIHDSDTLPGLTNRILSRWAVKIGTGAPLEYYDYPEAKACYVGIPVAVQLQPANTEQRQAAKARLQLPLDKPLLLVTGGGLGATRINNAVMQQQTALRRFCSIVLLSGATQYDELRQQLPEDLPDFRILSFVSDMPSLLEAADAVVARAGATTMAELAMIHMPTIVVPNARLTGGHQLKNAAMFADADAITLVDETELNADSHLLTSNVRQLLSDPVAASSMGSRLGQFARPKAAEDMAKLITTAGKKEN